VKSPAKTTTGEEGAVSLKRARPQGEDRGLPPAALDELRRRIFGMPELSVKSTGSGFLIGSEGYIVTEDRA
jgi:hypothetical protein